MMMSATQDMNCFEIFLQKELQNLEDAGDEIMLLDDDTAPIPYPFSLMPVRLLLNSLLDCEQCLFSLKIRGEEHETGRRLSMTVSVTCEWRYRDLLVVCVLEDERKESAMVSYNIWDARHSGDGVILFVGLQNYDAHLSVTFISDMQPRPYSVVISVSDGVTPMIQDICRSILNFNLATFLLVLCFTLVFARLWQR